jgi:hypothetical protein
MSFPVSLSQATELLYFSTQAANIAIVLNWAFDLHLLYLVDIYKETDSPSAVGDFSSPLEQSLPVCFTRQLNPIRFDSSFATRVRTPRDIRLFYNLGAKIATRLRKTISIILSFFFFFVPGSIGSFQLRSVNHEVW